MVKRGFDIVASLIGLIILALPCLLIAILVRASSTGPAMYWSTRIGKDSKPFQMPKFRSMRIDTPEVATDKLSLPEQYVTKTGAVEFHLRALWGWYFPFFANSNIMANKPSV